MANDKSVTPIRGRRVALRSLRGGESCLDEIQLTWLARDSEGWLCCEGWRTSNITRRGNAAATGEEQRGRRERTYGSEERRAAYTVVGKPFRAPYFRNSIRGSVRVARAAVVGDVRRKNRPAYGWFSQSRKIPLWTVTRTGFRTYARTTIHIPGEIACLAEWNWLPQSAIWGLRVTAQNDSGAEINRFICFRGVYKN